MRTHSQTPYCGIAGDGRWHSGEKPNNYAHIIDLNLESRVYTPRTTLGRLLVTSGQNEMQRLDLRFCIRYTLLHYAIHIRECVRISPTLTLRDHSLRR